MNLENLIALMKRWRPGKAVVAEVPPAAAAPLLEGLREVVVGPLTRGEMLLMWLKSGEPWPDVPPDGGLTLKFSGDALFPMKTLHYTHEEAMHLMALARLQGARQQ